MNNSKSFLHGFFSIKFLLFAYIYYFYKFLDLMVSAIEVFLENRGDTAFWLRDILGDSIIFLFYARKTCFCKF